MASPTSLGDSPTDPVRPWAIHPQLKRYPLGRTQRRLFMPPYFVEESNLRSRDALLSLAWPILRGLLLLASVDAGTLALVEHSAAAAIARFARDALGALVIALAVTLALQELREDWRASRRARSDPGP